MENKEELSSLKCFAFASLISADNDEYTEEVKQEILNRYHKDGPYDWSYILEPIEDEKIRKTLIAFFEDGE